MILIVFLNLLFVFGQGHQEYSDYNEDKLDSLFQPSILSAVIVLADKKRKPPKEEITTEVKSSINMSFHNCEEALDTLPPVGGYPIKLPTFENLGIFNVRCFPDPEGGRAWTAIQHHSEDGAVDFNRGWHTYKEGLGELTGDFFLGLTYIHALTHSQPHELWIKLFNSERKRFHAHYNLFAIGDESQDFTLLVLGKHSGNLSDALRNHVGQKFSTSDKDNDGDKKKNCAKECLGGWWFYNCEPSDEFSNLNGNFIERNKTMGIRWDQGRGEAEFQKSYMFIRPVSTDLN